MAHKKDHEPEVSFETDPVDLPGDVSFDTDPGELPGGVSFDTSPADVSADQNLITSESEVKKRAIIPNMSEAFNEFFLGMGISLERMGLMIDDPPDMTHIPGVGDVPTAALPAVMQMQPDILAMTRSPTSEEEQRLSEMKGDLRAMVEEQINRPGESVGGEMIRTLGRYSTWLPITIAAARGAGLGPWTGSVVGGAVADLATFDPTEDRLSNMLTQFDNPVVNNAVTQYLAADPNDSEAEGRFKQTLEGVITGGLAEGAARTLGRIMMFAGALRRKAISRWTGVRAAESLPAERFAEFPDFSQASLDLMDKHASQVIGRTKVRIKESKVPGTSPERMTIDFIVNNYLTELRKAFPDVPEELIVQREVLLRNKLEAALKPPTVSRTRGEALDQAFEDNRQALEELHRRTWRERVASVKSLFIKQGVDRSGTFKREILESGGSEAKRAVQMFELAQGASTKAEDLWKKARGEIFGGLNRDQIQELNQIIMLRRFDEILKYRPDWKVPLDIQKHLKTKGARVVREDITQNLNIIRERVGEVAYDELMRRSSLLFSETRKALDVLLESGIISKAEHTKLAQFRFTPVQMLEELDPIILRTGKGPQAISVRSSGIKPLANVPETERILLEDNEMFLGQIIARAHSRAARNNANQALLEFARKAPDNPVVKLKRPNRTDWAQVSVMEDGAPKKIYIRKDIINEWSNDPIGVSALWNNLNKAFFWTSAVRPLATGINPEFALVNFPRDVMFAWLTAGEGRLYATGLPRAAVQMTTDLAQTARDAWRRGPAFEAYLDEGGGMSLLTHGARMSEQLAGRRASRFRLGMAQLSHFAGYVNESSELWVRLAIRNRALKRNLAQGMDAEEAALNATWEARRYLDFAQGGSAIKLVDQQAIPYLNAAAQGMRGAGRAAWKNPGKFAMKISQLAGIYAGFNLANRTVNPEAWDQIPEYVKNRNFVLTTPFYRIDEEGNKRYMYFKFPIDHTTMPLKTFVDASLKKYIEGEAPTNIGTQFMGTLSGPVPIVGNLPPSGSGLLAILGNYDWWRDEDIWKGREDIPEHLKVYQRGEQPTSQFFKDVGEFVSPLTENTPMEGLGSGAKLQAAMQAAFPRNVYTDAVGWSYKSAFGDQVVEEQVRGMQQAMSELPILRRFVGETHPLVGRMDHLRELIEQGGGEQFVRSEALAIQYQNFIRKDGDFNEKHVGLMADFIATQPPVYQQGMRQYLINIQKAHEVFKTIDPASVPGTPPRDWWIILAAATPETKALALVEELSHAKALMSSEDQEDITLGRRKQRMLLELMGSVPGFSMDKRSALPLALHKVTREQGVELEDLLR